MRTLNRILYSWLPWAIPIGLATVGWHWGGWLGAIGGVVLGLILAVVAWGAIYYLGFSRLVRRRRIAMSKLSTDALKEVATDPTSFDLGFAATELSRRGIEARPSIESLCALLLSGDSNRRGLAMSLFFAAYPTLWGRASRGEGWSNMDPNEVWEERVRRIRAQE